MLSDIQLLLHALDKGTEGFHLCSKEQITQLSIGKEHNKEHDSKAHDVFCTTPQCRGQLSHGLIETDVLENLQEQERAISFLDTTFVTQYYIFMHLFSDLPLSKQRTSSLHSCYYIVFARMLKIQNLHRYPDSAIVCQVIYPL